MTDLDAHERRPSPALREVDAAEAADPSMSASAAVERTLLAEVRSLRGRRRISYGTFAIAASLALTVLASSWILRELKQRAVLDLASGERVEALTEFVPLGYNRIPAGPTHIIRMEVPRRALASFGLLPMDAPDPSDSGTVLADVIIGDDGLARAVRFVRPVSH